MDDKDDSGCGDGEDFAVLGPPADGGGQYVLRHLSDCSWQAGVLRPLEDGKPVHGEIVCLRPREDGGPGYAVESVNAGGKTSGSGPAMVNSKAFRDGWDGIFGKKVAVGEA